MRIKILTVLLVSSLLASCGYQRVQSVQERKILLNNVLFGFDKVTVKKSDLPKLEENSKWLIDNADEIVILGGHCDERGSSKYNMDLGDRRARWVKSFLIKRGVNPRKVVTISYGEKHPEEKGHNVKAWSRNRRVVFRLGR